MTYLYRCYDVDEETPVQFVGVYTTRWCPEWGEPTVMFREVLDAELAAIPPVKALVEACEKADTLFRVLLEYGYDPDADSDMEEVVGQTTTALAPFQEAE